MMLLIIMKQVSLQKNYMKYVVHLNLGDLLRLFKMGNTSLKGFEDDKKIELDFKLWDINKPYIASFYLKEISRQN